MSIIEKCLNILWRVAFWGLPPGLHFIRHIVNLSPFAGKRSSLWSSNRIPIQLSCPSNFGYFLIFYFISLLTRLTQNNRAPGAAKAAGVRWTTASRALTTGARFTRRRPRGRDVLVLPHRGRGPVVGLEAGLLVPDGVGREIEGNPRLGRPHRGGLWHVNCVLKEIMR